MSKLSVIKETLKETECSCDTCKSMCRCPCIGTPEDIKKIIDAGFEDRLSVNLGARDLEHVRILSPALKEFEGKRAHIISQGAKGCTFWKNGLCELHELGLKPIEGKLSYCKNDHSIGYIADAVVEEWDSDEGREMVKSWCERHNVKQPNNILDLL